jgi:hypothetical protein
LENPIIFKENVNLMQIGTNMHPKTFSAGPCEDEDNHGPRNTRCLAFDFVHIS